MTGPCWIVEILLDREGGFERWTQSIRLTYTAARRELAGFLRDGRKARLKCLCERCEARGA